MTKEIKNLGNELLFEVPTVCSLLFAGSALYMSQLDPIVRNQLENKKLQLGQWAKMYNLGKATMPILVILGSGAALAAFSKTKERTWLWGAATFFFIIPFTFAALMPTNNFLEDVLSKTVQPQVTQEEKVTVTDAMKKWVRRHRVRGLLALGAAGIFFVAKQLSKSSN